jgi:sec-independent protein translocase protein TatB
MFEFDAGKLVIIGIVALIVIGPKELPRVLRQAGQAIAKLRHMASEFQGQFMDAMREAELTEIKDEAAKLAASARIDTRFNPIADLRSELTRAIEGPAAAAPAGEEGGALALPAQADAGHSILAPEGFDGIPAEAPMQDASDEPPPSDVGAPRSPGMPQDRVLPVSRT